MNETIQTAMQSYLVEALNQKTQNKTVSVSKYLDLLKLKFLGFKNEVENNVKQSPTVKETLDYLSKLQIDFQDLLMFFEGSFEILLFAPSQTESIIITALTPIIMPRLVKIERILFTFNERRAILNVD